MRIVPASIAAAVLSMAAVSPVLAQTAAPAKISVIHAGALLDKPGQAPRGASTLARAGAGASAQTSASAIRRAVTVLRSPAVAMRPH